MALDTIMYPHDQIGIWGYEQEDKTLCEILESNNLYQNHEILASGLANNYNLDYCSSNSSVMHNHNVCDTKDHWGTKEDGVGGGATTTMTVAAVGRRKRRRTKSGKNKHELENQRMTHITVERNRRKQMNQYLAVIRSLMPSSYVQRGDQASIIGGAINFVKELEQQLQTLEVQKRAMANNGAYAPFGELFTFPQYSTRSTNEGSATAMAEIEVTMVESHANLKILSKKRHRQLLRMVGELQCLWLTILHLNVTTVDHMVLYSLSVKLEDGCQLSTVDEIANALNCILGRIEEEQQQQVP